MKVARRKKHVQNICEMQANFLVKIGIKARIDAATMMGLLENSIWQANLNYSNTSFAFKLITQKTKIIHVPD